MQPTEWQPDLNYLRRRFDRLALRTDDVDFVQRATFEGLMDRIAPMVLRPAMIVDIGSASGKGSRELAKRFRGARLVSVDASIGMLRSAKSQRGFLSRVREVNADARKLPLADQCADLVVANLTLAWLSSPDDLFAEASRILKPGGLFLFATLGPDSLRLVRDALRSAVPAYRMREFPDMHDIGDALVRNRLADPVLDVEQLNVSFPNAGQLLRELSAAGGGNIDATRPRGLTPAGRFRSLEAELNASGSPVQVGLELVYGHAWGISGRNDAVLISPDSIRMRRERFNE